MVAIRRYIKVNEKINSKQIRLIGPKGEQVGIVPREDGLKKAKEFELDLVEVAPQANPPVCRIMDFSKFKFDQQKKEREARKHQRQTHLKEIRMRPHIEEHDYLVKLKHAQEFLKKGDKVKVSLFFRGREIQHTELGNKIINRFINDIQDSATVERGPLFEGSIMTMMLVPKHIK